MFYFVLSTKYTKCLFLILNKRWISRVQQTFHNINIVASYTFWLLGRDATAARFLNSQQRRTGQRIWAICTHSIETRRIENMTRYAHQLNSASQTFKAWKALSTHIVGLRECTCKYTQYITEDADGGGWLFSRIFCSCCTHNYTYAVLQGCAFFARLEMRENPGRPKRGNCYLPHICSRQPQVAATATTCEVVFFFVFFFVIMARSTCPRSAALTMIYRLHHGTHGLVGSSTFIYT